MNEPQIEKIESRTEWPDVRLSVVQAAKVLSFLGRNVRGNLHNWSSKGIFSPIEPAPHRDPRGSRLDFADLVTVALLDGWFLHGVRFHHLKELARAQRQSNISKHFYAQLKGEYVGSIVFSAAGLPREQAEALFRPVGSFNLGPDRILQRYLEALSFQVGTVIHHGLYGTEAAWRRVTRVLLLESSELEETVKVLAKIPEFPTQSDPEQWRIFATKIIAGGITQLRLDLLTTLIRTQLERTL